MDEPSKQYAKWSKSDTKGQIQRNRKKWRLPGIGGREEWGVFCLVRVQSVC